MIMESLHITEDIEMAFIVLFKNLNWAFIIIFSLVIYEIKSGDDDFEWYNELFRKDSKPYKLRIWIAGAVVMLMYSVFCYLENPNDFNAAYVSSLLRSFVIGLSLDKIVSSLIKGAIERQTNKKSS